MSGEKSASVEPGNAHSLPSPVGNQTGHKPFGAPGTKALLTLFPAPLLSWPGLSCHLQGAKDLHSPGPSGDIVRAGAHTGKQGPGPGKHTKQMRS